jgi:surface protein
LTRMFNFCRSMTGIGANWNWPIKGSGQISGMFAQSQFQGDVSMWDTSDCFTFQHLSNDARGVFEGTPFNGDISTKVIDPGGPNEYTAWDTSNVTNMARTFTSTSKFNQNIGSWDTSNVTTFAAMFWDTQVFNNGGSSDIGNWDTSSATDMFLMFGDTVAFNQPIGTWDTSNVTNMQWMFLRAAAFNQDIGNWNVGKVTNFNDFMFGKTPATFSAANLSAIYNGWIAYELQTARTIVFGTAKYTSGGVEGRALLTRTNSTVNVDTITDDSGDVKVTTVSAHGLTTGNKIFIKDVVGTTEANGLHTVTVIDTTNFTLDSVVFTNAYVSGGNVRTGYGWTISDGGEE